MVARLGLVNIHILPPFSRVAVTFVSEIVNGRLGIQTLNSIFVILMGFGISLVLSVIIIALCTSFKAADSLFDTLTTILNPLPAVAIMPLIIMWFGIDMTAMLVVIVHGVLWALARQLLDALRAIPDVQIAFGRNIRLSPLQMFTGVAIFAIMPGLIAGLRIGWGRAWRALISVEMVFGLIGALGGLGHFIYMGRVYARIEEVFAGIIMVAIIGVVFESFVFTRLEIATTRKWGMTRE